MDNCLMPSTHQRGGLIENCTDWKTNQKSKQSLIRSVVDVRSEEETVARVYLEEEVAGSEDARQGWGVNITVQFNVIVRGEVNLLLEVVL